ncbi:M1 family metallopeptidase [Nocardia terpenica]|uniref:M1 family metallopeptidase n=1 Tax=Nocardia terpenica TaxID=455432 RepID=UPI0018959009|nr:M1 family metallopeptidase [Nocardia terpenica]MBF6063924.1 M1 family metallopeptidase [Nocardia terpenica]MBF6107840.1 M1 family metallopeptidase [Nocardia terpenica]MBF6114908.1 M1 family metallopeptidase [Nocardia terpenica]MBF6121105.1 M1 family metallopeptidase [Nocardia terpenica]MBF6153353.1 M1 family metallopeptidase [Nocardia terpenica]
MSIARKPDRIAARSVRRGLPLAVAVTLLCGPFATAAAEPPGFGIVGSPGLGDPYYPLDGNGGYHVGDYDLTLDYDPASHALTGRAVISATATQLLAGFNLDYQGPDVRAVSVNGLPARFDRNGEHELTITPALPLLPRLPFTVTVDYSGVRTESDEGWYYTPDGGAFVSGQPHAAPLWFPVNDTPQDKSTYSVHVTVPVEWDVVGNGIRTEDEVRGDKRTVTWRMNTPMISYLATIAIDKFTFLEQRRANGTPLLSAFAPGMADRRALEQRLPEILDFLEDLYGPYPFEAGGGTYMSNDIQFSLETQSRPTYAGWAKKLGVVVHENTHQWWGDSMSITHWSDICMNECFASYTADFLWPERKEGADPDAIYRKVLARIDEKHPEHWAIPPGNPGAGREFTSVYTRGELFLHALRRTVGDDVFFAMIKEWVQGHRNGNDTLPAFEQFVEQRSGRDLGDFFDAWLMQPVRPADRYLYPGGLSA